MEKIFKDKHGREFVVKTGEFENPNTGEVRDIDIGKEPRLNPSGKQVRDPLVMTYDHLGDVDITGMFNDNYPYLYFGSEFGQQKVMNLPTEFSNAIDAITFMGAAAEDVFGELNDDCSRYQEMIENYNKNIVAAYIDQFVNMLNTNLNAIYNNNLRFILEGYLKVPSEENKFRLSIFFNYFCYEFEQYLLDLINKEIESNDKLSTDESINLSICNIATANIIHGGVIYNSIARAYGQMITNIMRDDLVDFYSLAKDYIQKNNITGIAPEFYYSYGVDIVKEIANQEVGRLCDLAEINLNFTIRMIYNNIRI